MNLAHLAGKWGPIFRQTIKKPKENQGFWLQPLKNLMNLIVFYLVGPLGPPGGPMGPGPMGPMGPRGYIGKLPINRLNGGVMLVPWRGSIRWPSLQHERPPFVGSPSALARIKIK